jgi:hypothetical protein
MFNRSTIFTFTISAPLLFAAVVSGQTSSVEGDVKGVDGRVAKGAEVRIERQDKKASPIVVQTNSGGRFLVNNLPAGNYAVVAKVSGGVTSPTQTVKLTAQRPIMISFDLRGPTGGKMANARKKKRYVWVPEETGSHLGGRYVEVPEDATGINDQTPNLQQADGRLLQRVQSIQTARDVTGGGH